MTDFVERRLETVRDHMALECVSDWDAVRGYFAFSRTPFPDQANEIIAIAHGGDTVLVEFCLTGTHLGPLRLPGRVVEPTGGDFMISGAAGGC